jgi:hypothetical protein
MVGDDAAPAAERKPKRSREDYQPELASNPSNASRIKKKEQVADWDVDVEATNAMVKSALMHILAQKPNGQV